MIDPQPAGTAGAIDPNLLVQRVRRLLLLFVVASLLLLVHAHEYLLEFIAQLGILYGEGKKR